MEEDKTKIIEKYKDVHLGYYDYKDDKYRIEDFLNEDFLVEWIIGIADKYDQGVTHQGLDFINEYYGIKNIIDKVLEKSPQFPFDGGDPYKFLEGQRERSYSAKD